MIRVWTVAVGMTMGLVLPLLGYAQAGECLPPTAGLAIVGSAAGFSGTPNPNCEGPDYGSSLGPIIDYAAEEAKAKAKALATMPVTPPTAAEPAKPKGPLVGAGEGADLYDLEAGTGGTPTQYKDRELERLGELDAMQGKPLNMAHAQNLSYLKGYTRGQERKAVPQNWR